MPHLEFGASIAGLLVDGVEETPYVGATLRLLDPRGVEVEVPYFSRHKAPQFTNVDEWFSTQTPPKNMLLYAPEGAISLFDVAWGGHSENWGGVRTSVGTLRPSEAVLGRREGPLEDPLLMAQMHSRIDGLNEWTRLSSVSHESETDENNHIQAVTYKLRSPESVEWQQGEARLTLRGGWTIADDYNAVRHQTRIEDTVTVVSEFDEPRSFWDHFVEQRKVATLLVFLYGRPISFREHRLRDDRFAARMNNGRIYDHPRYEIISRHTIRDRTVPVPTRKELGRPIAHLGQITGEGLHAWSNAYEPWSRFILPSMSVVGRTSPYIEDLVVSTSMGLEAAGGILGEQGGEGPTLNRRGNPTTSTYVYRVLHHLALNWGEVGSEIGLARAVANNYNDVKHADRGDFPDNDATFLVSRVNRLVVRLLALTLTGRGDELLEPYRTGGEMWSIKEDFRLNHLGVNEDGSWNRVEDQTTELPPGITT